MTITFKDYKFSDLYKIECVPEEFTDSPFTFIFDAQEMNEIEGTGAGIYLIFDKHQEGAHRLIYVGEHHTERPFHSERVNQHIASITFRQEVAFGLPETANNIKNINELKTIFDAKYGKNTKNSVLYEKIIKELENYSWRVTGGNKPSFREIAPHLNASEVSRRRFEYACTFWDFFKDDDNITDECFNERFMFTWIDLNSEVQELVQSKKNIKLILLDIERQLISKFHPIVNNEMLKAGIMLDKDYSKIFSLGNTCLEIRNKVRIEIEKMLKTYKVLIQ